MQQTQGANGQTQISGIGLVELSRLLGSASASFGLQSGARGQTRVTIEDDDNDEDYVDEEEEEEEEESTYYGSQQRTPQQWFPPIKEPQEAGTKLLLSGEYGRMGARVGSTDARVDITRLLRERGTRARPSNYKEDVTSVSYLILYLLLNRTYFDPAPHTEYQRNCGRFITSQYIFRPIFCRCAYPNLLAMYQTS